RERALARISALTFRPLPCGPPTIQEKYEDITGPHFPPCPCARKRELALRRTRVPQFRSIPQPPRIKPAESRGALNHASSGWQQTIMLEILKMICCDALLATRTNTGGRRSVYPLGY